MGTLKRKLVQALPWSLWGPTFKLATGASGRARAFRRTRVGKGTYVDPSIQIIGWQHVRIGSQSTLSEGCWLNVNHRQSGIDCIEIGDHCHIGRRNFLSSGPSIRIADFCFTGLDCHFLGCGHDTAAPTVPYVSAGLTPGAPIAIGANVWLTTAVTVHQGVEIGCGSVIGAHSVVLDNIPRFSIAFGNPCKVIKRFDFRNNCWIAAEEWRDDLDRYAPTPQELVARLQQRAKDLSPALLSGSSRFGWL